MNPRKLTHRSDVLGRPFHVDVVEAGETPSCVIVMFGGSGVSAADYEAYASVTHPALAPLSELGPDLAFVFAYVTAPYDVPYARFGATSGPAVDDATLDALYAEMDRWNKHVTRELLPLLPAAPLCLAAHSGGIALAWHGLEDREACVGLWALGADAVVPRWARGERWRGPAVLSYNRGDRVRAANQRALSSLSSRGVVRVVETGTAEHGHKLEDYARSGALAALVRAAVETATSSRPR